MPFSGVYCVKDGEVRFVSTDLDAPNGLALSLDEKMLYVNNWNDKRKVILSYEVNQDCTLSNGRVYSTGPGGLWIISPEGKQLGLIKGPEDPHNMAWSDDDGKTLYITALTGIYRIRENIAGVRP